MYVYENDWNKGLTCFHDVCLFAFFEKTFYMRYVGGPT